MRRFLPSWLVAIIPLSLVGSCSSNPAFVDICSLTKAPIPYGKTIRARAIVIPAGGGWYGEALTGKSCFGKIVFKVEGDLPPNLQDRTVFSIKESANLGRPVAAEADVTFEVRQVEPLDAKVENPLTGVARITTAENITIVATERN